jgi:hypothetical protein
MPIVAYLASAVPSGGRSSHKPTVDCMLKHDYFVDYLADGYED